MTTKMVGIPLNLKWKFPINATFFMQNFVALPKWLYRKFWPLNHKIASKKSFFWVHWPAICNSCGTQVFSSYFVNTTSQEVPKKISFYISKKWLSYDCFNWRDKNRKMPKIVFFWYFRKKFCSNTGHNSLNSTFGMLHDIRD